MAELRPLLDELETQWRIVGARVTENLLAPASSAELSRVQAVLPVPLHPDIETLWRWHNGAARAHAVDQSTVGPCGFELLDTHRAAVAYRQKRVLARDLGLENATHPDEYWKPEWLQVAFWNMGESNLAVDCLTGDVRFVNWWDEGSPIILASSLAEVIQVWVRLLQNEVWRWEHDAWVRAPSLDQELAWRYPQLV